jgi:lysophospholipase L1-like esterase
VPESDRPESDRPESDRRDVIGRARAAGRAAAVVAALVCAVGVTGCTSGSGSGSGSGSPAARATSSPAAPTRSASGSAAPATTARYYLSLGDSIAFGFQQQRFDTLLRAGRYRPSAFPGFTTAVARSLAAAGHPVTVVNYGCPGETTVTFMGGGCPFRFVGARLHDPYDDAQLIAAVDFLRQHRGAVSLVTVALGSNDLSGLRHRCGVDVACLRAGLPHVSLGAALRLARALRQLRVADPTHRTVLVLPYDPLAVDAPGTVALLASYDRMLAGVARQDGARVADALAAFNAGGGAGRICHFTLYCTPRRDTHPSDAGYAELARLVTAALRSAR